MNLDSDSNKFAFNMGFKDGLNTGEENNPFEDSELFWAYRSGYDSGVAEYCHQAHPEDYQD